MAEVIKQVKKRGRPRKIKDQKIAKRNYKKKCPMCADLNKKYNSSDNVINTSYDKNKLIVVFD